MCSVTDVEFRHFGHIVRMDGNTFQSITIPFDYVLFNSRIRKHNCTSLSSDYYRNIRPRSNIL